MQVGKQKHEVRSLLIQQSMITGLLSSEIGDEIIENLKCVRSLYGCVTGVSEGYIYGRWS